jgi:lipopolysaccharide transport system permease protein
VWSVITPLLTLAVFTIVFGTMFPSRWLQSPGATSVSPAVSSTGEFAVILFLGTTLFAFFSEVISRAPGLVVSNHSYVKKVVFPLEVLPAVAVGSALFTATIALGVQFAAMLAIFGKIPLTAFLLPVVVLPFVLLTLGLAWFLAALGVYVRDVSQVLGPILTALMFLSPIFYPLSSLPEWLQGWQFLNPLTIPIEQARNVVIWGQVPDLGALGLYTLEAIGVSALGLAWFQQTRRGFADVL